MINEAVPIPRLPRQESYALSAFQRGLWSLVQASPGNPFYNASRILKLIGPLDFRHFHRALELFVARHDVLRASFAETGSGPFQRIAAAVEIDLPLEDLSALPAARREARLRQWIEVTAWSPFDLGTAPLIRFRAFRFAAEDHRLVVTAHHLVSDGASGRLMMEELAELYPALREGSPPLAPPALQYHDFSHWQNERLASGALAESERYWLRRLGGDLPDLELPADRRRPTVPSYRGAQHRRLLSAGLTGKLKELRRKQGTTIFRVVLAALDTFFVRMSGDTDVIVGSPVSGRTHPVLHDVQGLFVNMLAMRSDLSGDPPFTEVLARIKQSTREDIDRREFPFDTLVQRLNPRRDPGRPPIFNVVLVMREPNFASELQAGPLVLSQDEVPLTQVSRYDLTLIVAEIASGLRLTFEYNTDLFDPSSMVRMAGNLERLLEGVVTDPGKRISCLPLLTDSERAAILTEWNDTEREVADERLLHQLFAGQVAASPDRVAVIFEGERLTYGQLNEQANQLAHYLRRLGVGPEVRVGICLERSLDLVVGLMGILKAGGAYVPLDPSYPRPRLEYMLEDSRVPVVLTHCTLAADLPSREIRKVLLDGDRQAIARESRQDPASAAVPDSAAYVIYTSGSTGSPKGALNTHRAICNRLLWMQAAYSLTADDRVLQKTPISFDVSVWEFFWPLLAGACLVVARPGIHRESAELIRLITEQEITTLHFVPSMFQAFLGEEGVEECRCLKRIFCSGEALSPELERRFSTRLPAELHNLYGPTEAAVDVTYWACGGTGQERNIPIGRPIANLEILVLDRFGNPVPIGVPGELHIGGTGLARGYLDQPGLTAASFVPHPYAGKPGARLYRTGDLARYRPDGNLEFIGRLDHQVKIRGVRVEPEEIEAALHRHPAVKEAVVVVRESPPGDRHLVACIVPRQEPAPTAGELRAFLATRLPAALVPAFFVIVDAIALTPSGKVDRGSLATAGARASGSESIYVAPRDEVEWELAELWEKTLGTQGIGVLDNFFALGGHSLMALSLVGEVNRRFGTAVPAVALVQAPTIAGMRTLLKAAGDNGRAVRFTGNLVPMRAGDPSQPPLFLMHAHRGGVFAYHALARALGGNYPIYGLQASGLDEGEEPLATVPALAARYVEQLRAMRTPGPYRLVGWSFGGIVAYEMARQLESLGEAVSIVALLDASPPEDFAPEALAADTLQSIGRAFFGLDEADFEGLDESRGLQLFLARGRDLNLLPAAMTVESLGRLIRLVRAHTRALSSYRPADRIRTDICLLLAATASQVRDPSAWRHRTLGACSVVTVPGPHHEMVFPPAVGELAAVLNRILDGGSESPAAVAALPVPARPEERSRFIAQPDREALSAGLGSCPLVLGECVQGRLSDLGHFLITSPVDAFSWAEFIPDPTLAEVVVDPPERTKAQKAVSRYLSATGRPGGGRLAVFTALPPGLGFGTSTADITASVRAASAAWGEMATPQAISQIAIGIEPADGSMYPGSVVFDHRRGELLECLGSLPDFHAVVVCGEGEVDTVAFDAYRKDFRYSPKDERELKRAWRMVRYAACKADVSVLGRATTISARINEQLLAKPYFAAMHEFMELAGLEGLIAGHSGTLLAFMLNPHGSGFQEKLDQARAFVDALQPKRRFEISNNELPPETRRSMRGPEEEATGRRMLYTLPNYLKRGEQ